MLNGTQNTATCHGCGSAGDCSIMVLVALLGCLMVGLAIYTCSQRTHFSLRIFSPKLLVFQLLFGAGFLLTLLFANDHVWLASIHRSSEACTTTSAALPYTVCELLWCTCLLIRLTRRLTIAGYTHGRTYYAGIAILIGLTLGISIPFVDVRFDPVDTPNECVICRMQPSARYLLLLTFVAHIALITLYSRATLRLREEFAAPKLHRAVIGTLACVLSGALVLSLLPDHSSSLRRGTLTLASCIAVTGVSIMDDGVGALWRVFTGAATPLFIARGDKLGFVDIMRDTVLRADFFDYVRHRDEEVERGGGGDTKEWVVSKPAHPFHIKLFYLLRKYRGTVNLGLRKRVADTIFAQYINPEAWKTDKWSSGDWERRVFPATRNWKVGEKEAEALQRLPTIHSTVRGQTASNGERSVATGGVVISWNSTLGRYTQIIRQNTPRSGCELIEWWCAGVSAYFSSSLPDPYTRAHYVGPLPHVPACDAEYTEVALTRELLPTFFAGSDRATPFLYGGPGTQAFEVYSEVLLRDFVRRCNSPVTKGVESTITNVGAFEDLELWLMTQLYYVHYIPYSTRCVERFKRVSGGVQKEAVAAEWHGLLGDRGLLEAGKDGEGDDGDLYLQPMRESTK